MKEKKRPGSWLQTVLSLLYSKTNAQTNKQTLIYNEPEKRERERESERERERERQRQKEKERESVKKN